MSGSSQPHRPHPYIGGRNAVLRTLAAWQMDWPGAPRVVVLTGSPGTGRTRILEGFLMFGDPEQRARLDPDSLDPATVPPDLPPPTVLSPAGRTTGEILADLADALGLPSAEPDRVFAELAARTEPLALVVPEVDRAGPVAAAEEPVRLVRELLKPLAALPTVRLVAAVPRALATELKREPTPGTALLIDLDEKRWSDPEGLAHQAASHLDAAAASADAVGPAGSAESADLPGATDTTGSPGCTGSTFGTAGAVHPLLGPEAAHRRNLAEAYVARLDAGAQSRLTVRLALNSALAQADWFFAHHGKVQAEPAPDVSEGTPAADPVTALAEALPTDLSAVLDLHATRAGVEPATLRAVLTPLALAEHQGLPAELHGPLASAVAGRDMNTTVAELAALTEPFVERVEGHDGDRTRTLLRLVHPALADTVRAGLQDVGTAQTRTAMALLEEVPEQDWSKADPYVRDHIASHTLAAGLLPQLLTDPGLFTYADPVCLHAAVESVPYDSLGAAARTYLRTAPALIDGDVPPGRRAELLEAAFTADGLTAHATALRQLATQSG
ncbi:ATP-binding protein [Streptomyces sp. XM4193]|uniref:ATP-binding protein n=1 Tax=Streptomyces sp. XM4193 TaxID=2929782 RepID=UPI001FFB6EA9|nr:ATP-binding protein [Streptomyces sp. XM4193]MCK1798902.1 ATP-binding protein [Streptomyces sp. XM4193]